MACSYNFLVIMKFKFVAGFIWLGLWENQRRVISKQSVMCLKHNSYKSLGNHFATFFKLQGLTASIFCVIDQ